LAIIASTIKGKGIPGVEDQENWHGKTLTEEKCREAIAALAPQAQSARGVIQIPHPERVLKIPETPPHVPIPPPATYDPTKPVSVRLAFGHALARVGADPRIIVMDGDVENSTHTQEFGKRYPKRLIECYIAEQNMLGIATGLGALGKI